MTAEVLFVINGLLFVIQSRARGRVCGVLSIPKQGFNRLVQSCPIARTVKYFFVI